MAKRTFKATLVEGTAERAEDDSRDIWTFDVAHLNEQQCNDLMIDVVRHYSDISGITPVDVLLMAVVSSPQAEEMREAGHHGIIVPFDGPPIPHGGDDVPPVPGGVVH